ncbi:hypothetical protein GF367_03625, partial [Candidatus Woesearchaeota archaeon]|nr:hypothetical protein [Candidatus Woesearchaeota archaeon]
MALDDLADFFSQAEIDEYRSKLHLMKGTFGAIMTVIDVFASSHVPVNAAFKDATHTLFYQLEQYVHDLRTPADLTRIGFQDLALQLNHYYWLAATYHDELTVEDVDEDNRPFVHLIRDASSQMRRLENELFYGINPSQEYTPVTAIQERIADHPLLDKQVDMTSLDARLSINESDAYSVIENMLTNARKYSDGTISVMGHNGDANRYTFTMKNVVGDKNAHKQSSNNVGLRDMQRMVAKRNGRIRAWRDKDAFILEWTHPLYKG